jgi:hypothetical protein
VDDWLARRAAALPTAGTVRADEMAVNTVLEAVDVRWWSHSPIREVSVVTEISPAENGMLAVTFSKQRESMLKPSEEFARKTIEALAALRYINPPFHRPRAAGAPE